MLLYRLHSGILLLTASCLARTFGSAFQYHRPSARHVPTGRKHPKIWMTTLEGDNSEYDNGVSPLHSWTRRAIIGSGLLLLPQSVLAAETCLGSTTANLDALLDLPPVTKGCVRIFFCRHGQTENNRLRKVQGARVDPPINENGVQQAINLGQALGRLKPPPHLFFSSSLQRAQMTAQTASHEIHPNIKVQCLQSLSEVDFGPTAEGQPVALAKAGMQATYAAWATGSIDYRPHDGQGESGREVIERAIEAITTLARFASKTNEGCCVAVTHSTYLRILLAIAMDISLFEAASINVNNGGISVIDVTSDQSTRPMGKKSKLFSGFYDNNLHLDIPICHVIRINETCHLPRVPVIQ